ncbi:MAG TPA: hypothetical protein VFA75_06565 [Nevskia sp.]|nr:hypothetical protein [Nevskia sp.]
MNLGNSFAATILAGLLIGPATALAADHADAPGTKGAHGDHAADITDVFVFRRNGKLVGAINIAGAPAPQTRVDGPTGRYDPQVIFTYHIDTNCDARPDIDVNIRFGLNSAGQIGVQLENLPGAGATLVSGPVEKVNTTPSGLKFYSGLRDDPFFFDFEGFSATEASFDPTNKTSTGQLLFNNKRDSFGGRNITAIVFEMDPAAATQGSHEICVFATSGRLMQ